MTPDNSVEFHQRLSEWISNQGFWFQLRHSLSGGRNWSMVAFHLIRLAMRLAIVVALVLAVVLAYLTRQVKTDAFRDRIAEQLGEKLQAEQVILPKLARIQGKALISRLGMKGSQDSLFESLEARNINMNMGWLGGVITRWNAGTVEINTLDMELKAGFGDEESGLKGMDSLFKESPNFTLRGIKSENTRLTWGIYQRAYGEISGSKMMMIRTATGWRCHFSGGKFSQNWMRGLDIESLTVLLEPRGVIMEKGVLTADGGKIEFADVKITQAVTAKPEGTLNFSHVPIKLLVPPNAAGIISGTISGTLELGGALNTTEGLTTTGEIKLEGTDKIVVGSRFHVFESLDVVDAFNNYKRVEFEQGSFRLSTANGKASMSNISLSAGDLVTVDGAFTVTRPQNPEWQSDMDELPGMAGTPQGGGKSDSGQPDITLRKAGEVTSGSARPGFQGGPVTEEAKTLNLMEDDRRLRREAMSRARNMFQFSGAIMLTIKEEAVSRSPAVAQAYPTDPSSGRIPIKVNLQGDLGNIGLEVAEELLRLGEQK